MSTIIKHNTGGNVIRYTLYSPDGTSKRKNKYAKKRLRAVEIKKEADLLEALSKNNKLTHEDLIIFQHSGLLKDEEVKSYTGGRDTSPVTWERLRGEYEDYSRASHSAHNQKTMSGRLNNLAAYFKEIPLTTINVREILRWQGGRLEEVSSKTVLHEKNLLNQLLDIAVDLGGIPFNPGHDKRLKRTLRMDKSRLPISLTYDETKALLSAIDKKPGVLGGHARLAALIFIFAGLRRGEACYLTRDDINRDSVIVRGKDVSIKETSDPDVTKSNYWSPKGARPRTIDLPPTVAQEIRKLAPKKDRFLFGGKKVYHRDTISQAFDRLFARINPALSLHCLRHTFVTWRIEHGLSGRGDNLVRVQQAAGHRDIQTTMRYTHIKVSPEKDILGLI